MSGELILIVDNEPIFSLAQIYGARWISLIDPEDGEKAVRRVQDRRSDQILLDLMPANIEVIEVCQLLRAKKEYTPVLMLTVRGDDIDKILELFLSADKYLTTPFNPREMTSHVRASSSERSNSRNIFFRVHPKWLYVTRHKLSF